MLRLEITAALTAPLEERAGPKAWWSGWVPVRVLAQPGASKQCLFESGHGRDGTRSFGLWKQPKHLRQDESEAVCVQISLEATAVFTLWTSLSHEEWPPVRWLVKAECGPSPPLKLWKLWKTGFFGPYWAFAHGTYCGLVGIFRKADGKKAARCLWSEIFTAIYRIGPFP